jgi:HEAT repeat protein
MALSHIASGVDRAIPVLLRDVATDPNPALPTVAANGSNPLYFSAARTMRPSAAVIPVLVESLQSGNRDVRGTAAILLGRIGPQARQATPALIAAVKQELASGEKAQRRQDPLIYDLAPALVQVAPVEEALFILGEALRSPSDPARSAAASALARLGLRAHAAIPALLTALKEAEALLANPKHALPARAWRSPRPSARSRPMPP